MKKTYICPKACAVRFDAEASMMKTVSFDNGTTQSDDWSNERDWSNSTNVAWEETDDEE